MRAGMLYYYKDIDHDIPALLITSNVLVTDDQCWCLQIWFRLLSDFPCDLSD